MEPDATRPFLAPTRRDWVYAMKFAHTALNVWKGSPTRMATNISTQELANHAILDWQGREQRHLVLAAACLKTAFGQ